MITYFVSQAGQALIFGLSSDVKPSSQAGWMFIESDTGRNYYPGAAGAWTQAAGGNAAWGGITGTLSNQTDLQTALNGKQASGTYATGTGTANGTNTGDQTSIVGITGTIAQFNTACTDADFATGGGTASGTNTGDNAVNALYSGLAASKQDTLVSATNIKTVNGSSLLGSGNLVVSSGYAAVATLSGNQATGANVTPVTLTGLVWTYAANSVYFFRWIGSVKSAAATTGCGFQLDVSSAVTEIAMGFTHQLANTGTQTGGSSTADNVSLGVSSGVPTLNVSVPVIGDGMLRTGANTGTAQLMFRSETTAVTTAMAGMTLVVEKVA